MTLRCAVIGVGYLGRFHAQKYQQLSRAKLVAVVDVSFETSQRVAKELGVAAYQDHKQLFGLVDVVSIATPTPFHYAIARDCLEAGIHVLIEKPITDTVAHANTLIALAHKQGLKLQVGHLERFNTAYTSAAPHITRPLFIETSRLAPYNPRGTDVNVVLDLMIHDLELIQTWVKSPIIHIDAYGASVLSKHIDIANVRLHFENHCIANVTASRISFKTERKARIFQEDAYLSLDYHQKQFAKFTKSNAPLPSGLPEIISHRPTLAPKDALLTEIEAFLMSVAQDTPPLVTGAEGRDALATALMITDLIQHHQIALQHLHEPA